MRNTDPASERLEVLSYSGSRLDEHPVFIIYKGERYPVEEWSPLGKVIEAGVFLEKFFVKTRDGSEWQIAKEEDGTWILISKRPS